MEDIIQGWKHSRLLYSLKREVYARSNKSYFVIFLALIYAIILIGVSNAGSLVEYVAISQGISTEQGRLAVSYITSSNSGQVVNSIYIAFNSVILLSFITPLAGAANIPYFTDEELSSVNVNKLHRFFDGISSQLMSFPSLLQLVFLLLISSLTTISGGRVQSILFNILLWIFLLSLTTTEGWLIELLIRTISFRNRIILAVGLAAIFLTVIWADPNHGKTLFGLGEEYKKILLSASRADFVSIALSSLMLIGMIIVMVGMSITTCHVALSKPLPSAKKKKERRSMKLSNNITLALIQLMITNLMRIGEVRRPIITMLVLSAPTTFITAKNTDTLVGFIVALPLAIVLSWGVNAFGVLGPAMVWLRTLPHVGKKLLRAILFSQIVLIFAVFAICWILPYASHKIDTRSMLSIVLGTAVVTSILSYQSTSRSVKKPHMVRLSSRGDSIIPPLTMVEYTAKFAFTAGLAGLIIFYQNDIVLQLSLTALIVLFSYFRFTKIDKKWDESQQSYVTNVVANI